MGRLTDSLFVGFAVSPAWKHGSDLDPTAIPVEVVASRQIAQHPRYQEAVQALQKIFQDELAFPHIYSYPERLQTVTPGAGYRVDQRTGRTVGPEVHLAPGVLPPAGKGTYTW